MIKKVSMFDNVDDLVEIEVMKLDGRFNAMKYFVSTRLCICPA
jgi:hypothetical protein